MMFAGMALLVICLTNSVFSQPLFTPYTITRTTGITFNSIMSTGTTPNSTVGWRAGNTGTDDNMTNAISDPTGSWTFDYDNASRTAVLISTNGFVTFNTGTSASGSGGWPYGYVNSPYWSNNSVGQSVGPFYDDIVCSAGSNPYTQTALDSSIKYQFSGLSGNRVLTVEWHEMGHFASSTCHMSFQVKFYQVDNRIEFIYGNMVPGNAGHSYSCGLNSLTTSTSSTQYLLTQQTVNSTSFSSTAQDNLTSTPASYTMIVFSRSTTDVGIYAVSPPLSNQCNYSSSVSVVDSIRNYSATALDFSAHPVTVKDSIWGAVNTVLTYTISNNSLNSSAPLAAGAAMAVPMGTINMTAGGTYNFKSWAYFNSGPNTDQNHNNDTSSTTFYVSTVTATAANPTICSGGNTTLTATTPGFTHVFPITYAPVTLTSPTTITLANDGFSNPMVPIGFNFKYFCNNYDHLAVSANGLLSFSAYYTDYLNPVLPSNVYNNLIAFAWTDLNNPTSGTISYQTMGTTPNRQFIVNFNSVSVFGTTNITTQVILYETTNLIEIHENTVPYHNYTQGIEDSTGLVSYSPPNRNNLYWSASNDAYQFTSCPTYSWSPGATLNDSTSATPIASPTTTTTYTVTLNPGSACTKTATVTVTVTPAMGSIGAISGDTIVCQNQQSLSYYIAPVTNANSYQWDISNITGAGFSYNTNSDSVVIYMGSNSGIYTIRVRAYNSACNSYTSWVSQTIYIIGGVSGQWVGGHDNDWFKAVNWCGAIPTSTTDAVIDAALAINTPSYNMNMPVINASGAVCNNINIYGDGETFTINGTYNLDVWGDWVNGINGTSSAFVPNNSTVTFKGNTPIQFINGAIPTTFHNITVNRGSDTTTVLENVGGNFYPTTVTMNGNLSLINGLFRISEPSSVVQFTSAPTIPSTSGLELNGGTVTPGNYTITNQGLFRMTTYSSNISIGTSANNSFITSGTSALTEILGGDLAIAGKLTAVSGGTFKFNDYDYYTNTGVQSTITLAANSFTDNTYATFHVDATSKMQVIDGVIVFHSPNGGTGEDVNIVAGTGTKIIVDNPSYSSIFQFGDNVSSARPFRIKDSVVAFNNISINPTSHYDSLILDLPATIDSMGVLYLGIGVLNLNGNLLTIYDTLSNFNNNNTSIGAIQRQVGGFIYSENSSNASAVRWFTNSSTNASYSHIYPFGKRYGNTLNYNPFTFQGTDAVSHRYFVKIATYAPTTSTTAHLPYPSTPTNVVHIRNLAGVNDSANIVNRFWQIDVTGANPTATVTFTYGANELPANGNASMTAQRYNSSNNGWVQPAAIGGQSSSQGNRTVTVTGVSQFSPWTLSRSGSPMPVELTAFTANYNGKTVDLNWNTASEINNDHFTVEKTINQENFDFVAWVKGNGNTNYNSHYYAEDKNPYFGTSYYQLTQFDYNGNTTKSSLVPVVVGEKGFEIINTYVDGNEIINVNLNDDSNEKVIVSIYNILGTKLMDTEVNTVPGNNYFQFNADKIAQGVYLITVNNGKKKLTSKIVY